jgi:guanylate kinase
MGLLNFHNKSCIFIISAPAGTGKTSLVRRLLKEFSELVANISYTTRQPRRGEIEGIDYHFINRSAFLDKIAANDFLEYVELHGNYYGISSKSIVGQQEIGKHVIFVIDTKGALQLKKKLSASLIFISPPSIDHLRARLLQRQTENADELEKRLALAEIELATKQHYDYELINDDFDIAYQILRSIIIAECHRLHSSSQKGETWIKRMKN